MDTLFFKRLNRYDVYYLYLKNKMKISCGLLTLLFFTFLTLSTGYAQSQNSGQVKENTKLKFNVIPPPPEAASIAKYIDQPVNQYTGVPKIEIPIYNLQSYELNLPISLSYHASGIKWEEKSSSIGHGWSLNVGGNVTRTIRGRNDEEIGTGYFSSNTDPTRNVAAFFNTNGTINYGIFNYVLPSGNCAVINSPNYAFYNNILLATKGGLDLEPDVFYYTFPDGQSGKFVYSRSKQPQFIPSSYVDLNYTTNPGNGTEFHTWIGKGKDGSTYHFDLQERITNLSSCGEVYMGLGTETFVIPEVIAPTSWKLSKIVSANSLDTIWFDYEDELLNYQNPSSSTYYDRISGIAATPAPAPCSNTTNVYGLRLMRVRSKAGYSVEFIYNTARTDMTGGKYLDEIQIFYKAEFIKKFKLTRGGQIPTLVSLEENFNMTGGNDKIPSYEFTYYTEGVDQPQFSSTSYSVDHWGFYNAAIVEQYAFPVPSIIYQNRYYVGSDREAKLEACRWMNLKQIRYPTGGTTNFEYELNEYTNLPTLGDYSYSPGLELLQSIEFTVTNTSLPLQTKSAQFTLNSNTQVVLLYEIPAVLPTQLPNQPSGGIPATGLSASLSKSNDPTFSSRLFVSSQVQNTVAPIETFSSGTYTLTGEFKDGQYNLGNQKFYLKVYRVVSMQERVQNGVLKGGGLRLKKITSTGDNTITKTYEYKTKDTGLPSGKLMSFPVFVSNSSIIEGTNLPNQPCQVTATANFLVRANSSSVPLGTTQGSPVGYSEVIEYLGTPQVNNGYTVYKYTNEVDVVNLYEPFVPTLSYNYKNGLLISSTNYNTNNKPVASTANEYVFTVNNSIIKGLKVKESSSTSCRECMNRSFSANEYSEISERIELRKTIERQYDIASDSYIESISEFDYNMYDQVVLKRQSVSNSQNLRFKTAFKYHDVMKGVPTVEYKYLSNSDDLNAKFIEGSATIYHPTLFKPSEIWILESNGTEYPVADPFSLSLFKKRLTYNSFDSQGNVVTYAREGSSTSTAIIWDSSKKFPIAKVDNANATQVKHTSFENGSNEGGFTFSLKNNVAFKTGKQSHSLKNNLSFTLPEANKRYILSYWAKGGIPAVNSVVANNDDALAGADGWRYFEKVILSSTTSTITISGSSSILIDEVRLHPESANMITYTHDPKRGISTITDQNNTTTYYEYNPRHQLEYVKDFEKNILFKQEYRYSREN
ncbi:MAG: hypothetical protein ACK48F_15270 [Chryseotalea sp.]|jgi:hypothetical protein